jgi:cellulose synthase (UDP-forming)
MTMYLNPTVYRQILAPKKRDLAVLRFLILAGLILLGQFIFWYFDREHVGHTWLFWLLTFAFCYKLVHLLYEWFYFASMQVPPERSVTRPWTVDMLTTYMPGEPLDMIVTTLKAMVAVRYPHTTYLCDEGNDPRLIKICEELGVIHVYRGKDKTGAKAGNINYALKNFAKGEICVILDPDHVPVPEFLDRVLPHFENPGTGFVQCIQAYYNQEESLIARGAAEQTYLFYGPLMMGMQRHGTVQAIGANCTFRRQALDDIGGHATGLCEDLHTSMQLHARKWTSVYIPELLTQGKAPATLSAFYHQQLKWSRGAFELLFEVFPRLAKNFSWRQRFHYLLTPLYFFYGFIGLIDIGIPVISLFSLQVPLFIEFDEFLARILPVLVSLIIIRLYAQQYVLDRHEMGFHTMGGILRVGTWWTYLLGLVYSIFRVKVPYIPTSKGDEIRNDWKVCLPNIAVMLISLLAIVYGLWFDWNPYTWLMAGFAGVNVVLLGTITLTAQQKLLGSISHYVQENFVQTIRQQWSTFRHRYIYSPVQHTAFAVIFLMTALSFSSLHWIGNPAWLPLETKPPAPAEKQTGWLLTPHREYTSQIPGRSTASFPNNERKHNERVISNFELRGLNKQSADDIRYILSYCASHTAIPFIKWNIPAEIVHSNAKVLDKDPLFIFQQVARLATSTREPLLLQLAPSKAPRSLTDSLNWQGFYENTCRQFAEEGASNIVYAAEFTPGFTPPRNTGIFTITLQPGKDENFTGDYKRNGLAQPVLLISEEQPSTPLVQQIGKAGLVVLGWTSHHPLRIPTDPEIRALPNAFTTVTDTATMFKKTPFHWNFGKVKGVFYNPEHEWRDGRWPLTRSRLDSDFRKIKAMGANTITWYENPVYDKNVLRAANHHGLHVLYGLWLDPSFDYYACDTASLLAVKKKILRQVAQKKAYSPILAWMVGNSTWNDLANHFHPPYLTQVRRAYLSFLNELVTDIKRIDSSRPVISSLDVSQDFLPSHWEFQFVPAVDIIGLNVFDNQPASVLEKLALHTPSRPYLLTSFGPGMAWDTLYAGLKAEDRYPEQSSFDKARSYSGLWKRFIVDKNDADCLGGVAFCWRDRYEGTATMSGLTDYKGRLKPAYYALTKIWKGAAPPFPLSDLVLKYETKHLNGEHVLIFNALSPDNDNLNLTYEWYISAENSFQRIEDISINYNRLGQQTFWYVSNFYEHLGFRIYPEKKGRVLHVRNYDATPWQRIYLHISDHSGHVVTASFPLYSDKIIQRFQ